MNWLQRISRAKLVQWREYCIWRSVISFWLWLAFTVICLCTKLFDAIFVSIFHLKLSGSCNLALYAQNPGLMLTGENHLWLEPLGQSNFLAQDIELGHELRLPKPSFQKPWLRMQSTRDVTYKWRQESLEPLELAVPDTAPCIPGNLSSGYCFCVPWGRRKMKGQYGYLGAGVQGWTDRVATLQQYTRNVTAQRWMLWTQDRVLPACLD